MKSKDRIQNFPQIHNSTDLSGNSSYQDLPPDNGQIEVILNYIIDIEGRKEENYKFPDPKE